MKRLLFVLVAVALVCCGCASPIHMAAAVNNVAADTLNEAAPRLRKHCVDEVAALPDKPALEARKAECEPLTLSYDAAATGVGALRAALLAAAGGDDSQLAGAMAKVVALAQDLAKKMGGLK